MVPESAMPASKKGKQLSYPAMTSLNHNITITLRLTVTHSSLTRLETSSTRGKSESVLERLPTNYLGPGKQWSMGEDLHPHTHHFTKEAENLTTS